MCVRVHDIALRECEEARALADGLVKLAGARVLLLLYHLREEPEAERVDSWGDQARTARAAWSGAADCPPEARLQHHLAHRVVPVEA